MMADCFLLLFFSLLRRDGHVHEGKICYHQAFVKISRLLTIFCRKLPAYVNLHEIGMGPSN